MTVKYYSRAAYRVSFGTVVYGRKKWVSEYLKQTARSTDGECCDGGSQPDTGIEKKVIHVDDQVKAVIMLFYRPRMTFALMSLVMSSQQLESLLSSERDGIL